MAVESIAVETLVWEDSQSVVGITVEVERTEVAASESDWLVDMSSAGMESGMLSAGHLGGRL